MYLLATLLQGLYEGTLPDAVEGGYTSCLREIIENGISSQVYHLASTRSLLNRIPAGVVSELRSHYENVLAQNLYIRRHESEILERFESEQIEVIPLKGTRFSDRVFGHIGARGSSDIDILIHPTDFYRVCALLQQLGYSKPERYNPRHYHCMVRRQTVQGEVVVEIHWSLVKQYSSDFDIELAWQNASPLTPYQHVRKLSIPYTFYSMCLHGANHHMESWKHYLDIVQMLHVNHHNMSYDWLIDRAKGDKTFHRVQLVLSRVYDTFPQLHQMKPLGKLRLRSSRNRRFGLRQYDSFVYALFVAKDWLWPRADVARWFLNVSEDVPVHQLYVQMYLGRLRKAIRVILSKRERVH